MNMLTSVCCKIITGVEPKGQGREEQMISELGNQLYQVLNLKLTHKICHNMPRYAISICPHHNLEKIPHSQMRAQKSGVILEKRIIFNFMRI